eukprot:m.1646911 g.1646911  ORF g.1646911 m.1646911 type:complete len:240 (+) comp73566_c0_seq1:2-721(+)
MIDDSAKVVSNIEKDLENSKYYSGFEQQLLNFCCNQSQLAVPVQYLNSQIHELSSFLSVHGIITSTADSTIPGQQLNADDLPYQSRLLKIRRHYNHALEQLAKAQSECQAKSERSTSTASGGSNLLQYLENCAADSQQKFWLYQKYTILKMTAEAVTKLRSAHVPARRRRNLRPHATSVLEEWFTKHRTNPYPSEMEKDQLAKRALISVKQVNNWFSNKRNRSGFTQGKKEAGSVHVNT